MKILLLLSLALGCGGEPMMCKQEEKRRDPCKNYWQDPAFADKACWHEIWECHPQGYGDHRIIEYHHWLRPQ